MLKATSIQANKFLGLKSWINSFETPSFSQRKIAFFNYLLPMIEKALKVILNVIQNSIILA